MATKQTVIDFIMEQVAQAGKITYRKMFGEYALYCNGKVVALVCDDQLFVKPTIAGKSFLKNVVEAAPYVGAKPYFLISADQWDDASWLSQLLKITAETLPEKLKTKVKNG